MAPRWEPGTQYGYNDVVEYQGCDYKIIQPHRSQGDWAPDVVPALWGRIGPSQGGGHHDHHGGHGGGGYQQQQQQQPQQQQEKYNYGGGSNVPNPGPATPAAQPTQEEKQANWYDLSDERKKQLEIGGGIAAGAALLAGGYGLYHHRQKGQEEQKAAAWGLSNWVQDAKTRTNNFNQRGPQGPYTWVLCEGTNIPQGAIEGGRETGGDPLFIARAYVDGSMQLGKCGRHLGKGGVIGYDEKEVEIDTYEVLLGDPSAVKWVPISDNSFQPQRVVEGGREADGEQLYIAQAFYKGATHPGKYSKRLDGCYFPYGGKEKKAEEFRVLVLS